MAVFFKLSQIHKPSTRLRTSWEGSLNICTSMTIRMYAERKGWDVQNLEVTVDHSRERGHETFIRTISFNGAHTEEERERLIDVSHRCPVHKVMEGSATIITETITPPTQ